MNSWPALDRFLQTDPRDPGCDKAMELLDIYAEIAVADPAERSNGTRRWPRICGPAGRAPRTSRGCSRASGRTLRNNNRPRCIAAITTTFLSGDQPGRPVLGNPAAAVRLPCSLMRACPAASRRPGAARTSGWPAPIAVARLVMGAARPTLCAGGGRPDPLHELIRGHGPVCCAALPSGPPEPGRRSLAQARRPTSNASATWSRMMSLRPAAHCRLGPPVRIGGGRSPRAARRCGGRACGHYRASCSSAAR